MKTAHFSRLTLTIGVATVAALAWATPAAADLIISEIMYDPGSIPDASFEYVEILNTGAEAVDLTGYLFDDSAGTLTSPNITGGSIPAGGTAVLVPNGTLATMQSIWNPGINFIQIANNLDLNNTTDKIGLWSSLAAYDNRNYLSALDVVEYFDSIAPWPGAGTSASVYLRAPQLDNNIGTSWSRSLNTVDGAYHSAPAGDNNSSNLGSPGFVHGGAAAPTVSCCIPSGGCGMLPADDCTALGGAVGGPGSTCISAACPAPQACCLPHGGCGDWSPVICASMGGSPGGSDSSCHLVECENRCGSCAGDLDGNQQVNGDDVGPFVEALIAGTGCP